MLSAVIVAAGSSTRVGFNKILAEIARRPVIQYSIEAFERAEYVEEIIVVCRDAVTDAIGRLVDSVGLRKVHAIVRGGERRQDSVAAGLKAISASADFIAVHDAARPLITAREIERVSVAARKYGAASLAAQVTDTLKLAGNDLFVCGSIDRGSVFAMQTPQIFARQLLLDAYDRVAKESLEITDEVSAVEITGAKTAIVPAESKNMKITFASDLPVAEFILQQRLALSVQKD